MAASFGTIPHSELMKSVARRIADGAVLRLIKLWLKAPIEERDGDGKRRMSGGKSNARGTPQGGVASPLLANIYMNRFLKHWRLTARGKAFRAHVVAYADDFVILSRGRWCARCAFSMLRCARSCCYTEISPDPRWLTAIRGACGSQYSRLHRGIYAKSGQFRLCRPTANEAHNIQ